MPAVIVRRIFCVWISSVTLVLAACGGGSSGTEPAPPASPPSVAPSFTTAPADQSVNEPAAASWTVAVSGTPAPTVQWQQSTDSGVTWTDIGGAVATTYTLPVTSQADNGKALRVIATNMAGSSTSPVASLAVAAAVPLDTGDIAARFAAIAAVEDKLSALAAQGLTLADQITAVAAFMATRPEYTATGIDLETLSASGVFRDGRVHVVTLNFTPVLSVAGPAAVGAPTGAQRPSTTRPLARATSAAGAEVPTSSYARLSQSFGPLFSTQASIDDAKGYLQAKGWQLRGVAAGDARVETLRHVTGDGLFYLNTHGARLSEGVDPTKEPDGKLYALDSSTLKDPVLENVPEYAKDLATQRLLYFTAPNGLTKTDFLGRSVPISDTRYGITRYFVEKYWSFEPNAVVLVNACFSALNAEFISSVQKAQKKGASVYLGWTHLLSPEGADASLRYLVDRMVGANKFQPESPAQRPFPYDLVLADMASKGLDTATVTTDGLTSVAKLTASVNVSTNSAPILAPSIRELVVDEQAGKLRVQGAFGTLAGKVTVGGIPVTVDTWAVDEVVVFLPPDGPGSSGDVQVETHGLKSNLRQLSEWRMSLQYTSTAPSGLFGFLLDGTGVLRFRADVGGYRTIPGSPLVFPQRVMYATAESGLPLTGSGSVVTGLCKGTLTGSGKFLSALPLGTATTGLLLANAIKVDTQTRLGRFGLRFGGATPALPFKIDFAPVSSGAICNASGITLAPLLGTMEGSENFPGSPDNAVQIPLDALQISFTSAFVLSGRDFLDPSTIRTVRVQWSDVSPIAPPRDDIDSGK